jgi:hypothetical protein
MRVALLGPLAPWRGGLAQYLALLGESLATRAEVRGITFTRQYPELLFPGTSQLDPAAPRPSFPVEALLDSIAPWSWRRVAARLESFAPAAVILKWWMPFFAPSFASSVGPLRSRGTRVVLVCDNLVPHEHRPFDRAFTRWMLRNSDGYLVMSDSVERDLDRLKPGAPRRRVAHPLYAQFDRGRWTRETARERLGLSGEIVLFFGYIRRYKGSTRCSRRGARCAPGARRRRWSWRASPTRTSRRTGGSRRRRAVRPPCACSIATCRTRKSRRCSRRPMSPCCPIARRRRAVSHTSPTRSASP